MTMDALTGTLPIGATTFPMTAASSVDQLGGSPRTHTTESAVDVRDAGSQTLIDREAFLKLLVAQLRYQDPSKPIDSSELISQSAQLSVVDKLSEIASMLKASAATEQLSMAGSVVGRDISFYGPDGVPMTGTVTHVMFEAGEVTLGVGEWDVPFDAVLAIFERPPMPAPSGTGPAAHEPPPATPVDPTHAPATGADPIDTSPTGADAVADPIDTSPTGADAVADPDQPVDTPDVLDDPFQPQETTP